MLKKVKLLYEWIYLIDEVHFFKVYKICKKRIANKKLILFDYLIKK